MRDLHHSAIEYISMSGYSAVEYMAMNGGRDSRLSAGTAKDHASCSGSRT
jgi:hypothetical protein